MDASIVTLPGDGVGPEVTRQAVRVLRAVAARFGHRFDIVDAPIGGAAIEATGSPLPDATLTRCRQADAVLLGAVGGPRWDDPHAAVRPEQGLLALRRELGLFANLRPVQVHPRGAVAGPLRPERLDGVDLLFVRELTGGIYFGEKQRTTEHASDLCTYTVREIERVVRMAALVARDRRGRVTSIDKANVLETSRLWRAVTTRVIGDEFPELELEHLLVDAAAMHLLMRPATFDVIVTENMFGDILTDEASVLAGSIGLLPSASLGAAQPGSRRRAGVYEPIHGSAPELAERDVANPIGAVLSAALLLRHSLGLETEAAAIESAVRTTLDEGPVTADLMAGGAAASTTAVGSAIVLHVQNGVR